MLAAACALLALGSGGCEPNSVGGVDSERSLASLDMQESAAVCAELTERFDEAEQDPEIARGACLFIARARAAADVALTSSNQVALCEQHLVECLEQGPALGFNCTTVRTACPARVGQIDNCVSLALNEFHAEAAASCADASDPGGNTPGRQEQYRECSLLQNLCFPRP